MLQPLSRLRRHFLGAAASATGSAAPRHLRGEAFAARDDPARQYRKGTMCRPIPAGRETRPLRGDAEKRIHVILRSECDEESVRSQVQKILRFAQNDGSAAADRGGSGGPANVSGLPPKS